MAPRVKVPLTIAGSDPSGAAGLQADLKVFLRFGLSGAAVPTAVTAQSTAGVDSVHALTGQQVRSQLEAVLGDLKPAAVKVGLLPSAEVVRVVARALGPLARKRIPIILDPVLAASDGTRFLPVPAVPVMMRHLASLATLITPNVDEAAELAGIDSATVKRDPELSLQLLLRKGAQAVLLKGGHQTGSEAVDVLATGDEMVLYSAPRLPRSRNVRGTGCALSAAIAALMVKGADLEQAVGEAKNYVHHAIGNAQRIGRAARTLDFLAADG